MGNEFTYEQIQKSRFQSSVVVKNRDGLGMKVQDSTFEVRDVLVLLCPKKTVDVMDVNTQDALTMPLIEWSEYWYQTPCTNLLNMIGLEFS